MFTLTACGGSDYRAPVEDRQRPQSVRSGSYVVQRGDTLYSIAFRYGMDYRKVAAANGIPSPYTIYPGHLIYLREAEVPRAAAKPASTRSSSSSKSSSRSTSSSSPPVAASKPATVTKPSPAPVTKTTAARPKATPAPTGPVKTWRWPSSGKVIRGYSSSVHKGIDIAGKRGDGVHAVAAGTVVYSGTGIVGLGELLIIKHNETYLSAYGHNDRLLVAEGQRVSVGQLIAKKGSTGTDAVKLHFEIRREGKPVDPMGLLPRR